MADYLKVVYGEGVRPFTDYPAKMVKHLFDRFNMKEGMKILEPGSGRGEFLRVFKHLGMDAVALDISEECKDLLSEDDIDLVVCDVSFISLKTILPSILDLTNDKSYLVSLIKPQFEVGKGLVGKGGIVRDCILHDKVCNDIEDWINNQPSWKSFGVTPSPILGKSGNKEFLIFARKSKLYI